MLSVPGGSGEGGRGGGSVWAKYDMEGWYGFSTGKGEESSAQPEGQHRGGGTP